MDWAKRIPPRMCLCIFVLLNVITLLLFLFWNLEGKIIVRDWLVAVTSLSWLIYYLKPTRELFPKPIAFLSTISFEIYLVHHPLVFGEFAWIHRGDGSAFFVGLEVLLTMCFVVLASWLLHLLSDTLSKCVTKIVS